MAAAGDARSVHHGRDRPDVHRGLDTNQHAGAATPITAEGPGAARLGRTQQNTAVHDAFLAAMRGR